jgi:SAM-dependent methyltransferase
MAVQQTTRSGEPGELEEYWATYYRGVVDGGTPWLDYSNARVQAQTLALALEAAGPVHGLRCLDIGCGWGQLTRMLAAAGAVQPTGVDIVPELIAQLAAAHPGHRWACGSPTDDAFLEGLGDFDVVFAVEVLQVVPMAATVEALWRRVVPGGRLVGVVANGRCSIVQRTQQRFGDRYVGIDVDAVSAVLAQLPDVAAFAFRGMFFQQDQTLVPYRAGPWSAAPAWPEEPNRVQFVAQRTG